MFYIQIMSNTGFEQFVDKTEAGTTTDENNRAIFATASAAQRVAETFYGYSKSCTVEVVELN